MNIKILMLLSSIVTVIMTFNIVISKLIVDFIINTSNDGVTFLIVMILTAIEALLVASDKLV